MADKMQYSIGTLLPVDTYRTSGRYRDRKGYLSASRLRRYCSQFLDLLAGTFCSALLASTSCGSLAFLDLLAMVHLVVQ